MSRELAQSFVDLIDAQLELALAQLRRTIPNELRKKFLDFAIDLFAEDFLGYEEPSTSDQIAHARWRDDYNRVQGNYSKAQEWGNVVVEALTFLILKLPKLSPGSYKITIEPTEEMIRSFTSGFITCRTPGFFTKLSKPLLKATAEYGDTVQALRGTPLAELFPLPLSFGISKEIQFAHTWMLAGSGHGKTTALASMLYEHIPEVLKGEASIVLIDSQNVIIPALEHLKVWEHTDRLIIIDPEDPVALSLFDVPDQSPSMLASALETINFVFAKLTESDLTYRQTTMFDYLAEFLITAVPNATIHDFRNMLDPRRAGDYEQYYENASLEIQDYLATDFIKENFTVAARQQVLTKMRPMLRQPAFARMFGTPETKLDLFKELERGTCILIKPSKYLMGEDGTRLFGRFWIAQMKMVAQQRQNTTKKTPTYFYIDECQDYLRGGDPKIESILEQARKEKIGVTLIHHYADQLKSNELVQLLGANTATKICGSLATSDLTRFSSYLRCDHQFIQDQVPRKSFAVYVNGLTPRAVSLQFPFIDLPNEPRMSEEAWRAMRERNRDRYGATPSPLLSGHSAVSHEKSIPNAQQLPKEPPRVREVIVTHEKVKPEPQVKQQQRKETKDHTKPDPGY